MFTDQTLIIINFAGIAFLVILTVVLIAAAHMKGGAGWAAVIIVTTTVPMFLSNLTRDLASDYFLFFFYSAYSINLLLMPTLWFFSRSQFDKSFRLTARSFLHTIPVIISLIVSIIYYSHMTVEQIEVDRAFMIEGGENLPSLVNDVLSFGQFLIYCPVIFLYVRKRKKYLQDNYSDIDYITVKWTVSFLVVLLALIFVVLAVYAINPRTDTWLIPILNSVGMAYLVYVVIKHSTTAYIGRLPDVSVEIDTPKNGPVMDMGQMKQICDRVLNYLAVSGAYKNPDLSLSILSVKTGISPKNLSRSINGYLKRNFFDLVNEMRVEEAKKILLTLDGNHTIESVATDCGFRSRSTFFATFKKVTGKTPSQWMKIK